jgi:hypothetical protein
MPIAPDLIYAGKANPDVIRVRNAGVWSDEYIAPDDVRGVAASRDGSSTLWAILQNKGMYRKPPGGSWTSLGTASNGGAFGLTSSDTNECFVCQDLGVTRWKNGVGFTNWFGAGLPGQTVWAFSPTNVVSVGQISTHMEAWKFNGTSWSAINSSFGGNFSAHYIFSPDGVTLYVGASGARLFRSDDQGLSWILMTTPWPTDGSIFGIWGVSTSDLWIVRRTTDNGTDVAHFNGFSWTEYIRNSGTGCAAVGGTASNNVFFGHSNSGDVSRWTGAGFDADEAAGGGTFVGGSGNPLVGVPALPVELRNASFEIAGVSPGLAEDWDLTLPTGSEELADFDGSVLPHENFEVNWGLFPFNQNAETAFVPTDLEKGTFNDSTAEVEDFDHEWKRPITKIRVVFVGGAGDPNSHFTPGTLYRDLNTGGRAVAEKLVGTTTVEFTYVDFVNPEVAISGTGFAKPFYIGPAKSTIDYPNPDPDPTGVYGNHRIAELIKGYAEPGTGNGAQKIFSSTLVGTPIHEKQGIRTATFSIKVAIGGVEKTITDDGAGGLVSSAGVLATVGANSINYATGAIALSFAAAPDADAKLIARWDYGANAATATPGLKPSISSTGSGAPPYDTIFQPDITPMEPSIGELLPPWHHSGRVVFSVADLDKQPPETFESDWSSNENAQLVFAPSDLSVGTFDVALDEFEDFENEWAVSQGGNETSQSTFGIGDRAPVLEDFEGTWSLVQL